MSTKSIILVAGATGDLGGRITAALLAQGASVRALVRQQADPAIVERLRQRGVDVRQVDYTDAAGLSVACEGVSCLVSALAGLGEVLVNHQSALLDAAVRAGVPRFIPSDFCSDYTQQEPGTNRNFDLRRVFRTYLDQANIQATSVLNGAFGEILTYNIPLLNFNEQQVGYWGDADWKIDYTTKDDIAAFTAAAALDPTTPRFLRIASFQLSCRELAAVAESAGKGSFPLVRLGSRDDLAAQAQAMRIANPAGEAQLYADWQQLQYLLSMFSVQNIPLDNSRYADLVWANPVTFLAHQLNATRQH